jgi:hypothetical protein
VGFFMTELPRRLIEVDLPIKRISTRARREKSLEHYHIGPKEILGCGSEKEA